ncbi:MAG TPA: S41 family peptidase, partial [Vicinamibacteria bacterium]|nr:S41 family peptidase [Vicinamibacteria bacterium]
DRGSLDLAVLYWRALRPLLVLQIEIARGSEPPRSVRVEAEVKKTRPLTDLTEESSVYTLIREAEKQKETFYYHVDDDGIGYAELPSFVADTSFLSGLMGKLKSARATIVDLRGNLGGSRDGLVHFTGFFAEKPEVVAEVVQRKKTEPLAVKPRQPRLSGPLFVLVDSRSASAAEVFARHVQRTGRGKVIGDRTAGRVTLAKFVGMQHGVDTAIFYGVEVAVGRIVFPGNEELEKRGVTPDHLCIPTADDQREGRDPCMRLAIGEARKALALPAGGETPGRDQ